MENKQTAVDFLLHELSDIVGIIAPDAFSAELMKIKYLQAKEMEKEQIINSYNDGFLNYQICNSKQYYKQTYGEI